jgi:hypothetical protein
MMRKRTILTVLSIWCVLGVPAFGITSQPSAITYNDALGNQRIYCFATGAGGRLVTNYWDGFNWNWADQGLAPGGSSFSSPMAVTYSSAGSQKIYVFGISGNGHLAVNYWSGSNWNWADQGLPPGATSVSSPTAVTYFNGSSQNIYVFATSSNGHLVTNYWDGSWHWADQGLPAGATTISSLQALTYSVGGSQRIYVFGISNTGRLVVNYWNGSWHWADQGLPAGATGLYFSSAITYSAGGSQRIYVFGIANNNHLVVNYWDGASWHWADQGLVAGAQGFYDVNAVTYNVGGSQRIYVFTTVILSDGGLAGHAVVNYWDGSTWHWADQGLPSGVAAVYYPSAVAWVSGGSPRIYVFDQANAGDLYLNYWDGSAWHWTHQE